MGEEWQHLKQKDNALYIFEGLKLFGTSGIKNRIKPCNAYAGLVHVFHTSSECSAIREDLQKIKIKTNAIREDVYCGFSSFYFML